MKDLTLSKNQDTALRKLDRFVEKFILIGLIIITLLVCCSCSSTKAVTQLVRDVHTDTIYLSNMQYDSIYIYQDRLLNRSKDTVYLKDVSIEYRYKLLKDTVRIIKRDSIPYEVNIETTKKVIIVPGWIKFLAYIGVVTILSIILLIFWKLR